MKLASKICPKCKQQKPLSEFPKNKKAKRYGFCKTCHSAYQRVLVLKRNFNLTPEDYEKILQHQKGKCAVCGAPPKKSRLAVDHCHKSGLIRGLLCTWCNRILGLCRDNQSRFKAMSDYLRTPTAPIALGESRFGRLGGVGIKAATRKRLERKAANRNQHLLHTNETICHT